MQDLVQSTKSVVLELAILTYCLFNLFTKCIDFNVCVTMCEISGHSPHAIHICANSARRVLYSVEQVSIL